MPKKFHFSFILSLLNLARKHPLAMFNQLNTENWRTLTRAVMNEPPQQILNNIVNLLRSTSAQSDNNIELETKKFVQGIITTKRKAIICISHEATRTGAPAIIHKIGEYINNEIDYFPIYILCKNGDLSTLFLETSYTYTIKNNKIKKYLQLEINTLIKHLKDRFTISAVLFNSEGSTHLLKYFSNNKVNNRISLIHEMGSYYPIGSWKHINKLSDKILFPANEIKRLALLNTKFDLSKIDVKGQGLLKKELLFIDKNNSKEKLCKSLNISSKSIIILGCGLLDARKGIDIFTSIAIQSIRRTSVPLHFIWLGRADKNETQIWVERDIKAAKLESQIHFLGLKKNVAPYFTGSDLFLLTSRGDPYPCVVHEALASGLPVIAFKDSGGTEEIITEDIGIITPYADTMDVINNVVRLSENEDRLSRMSDSARTFAQKELDFSIYYKSIKKYWKN